MTDTTTTPQRPKLGDFFETVTCSRCGGEGRILTYSNVEGGICFKCGGSKRTFTARGERDLAAYRAAVDAVTVKPVASVKIGDAVRSDNMRKYVPVVAISEPWLSSWTTDSDGTKHESFSVEVTLDHAVWHDLHCPLSYRGEKFTIGTNDTIRIYPGADKLPKAESFDSRRSSERAA